MSQIDKSKFIKQYSVLMQTAVILNNKGIKISLSIYDKVIWNYMLCRYEFFTQQGMKYFESQDKIALALGCSTDTVQKSIKKLHKENIIVVHKEKRQGLISRNVYSKIQRVENLDFVILDVKGNILKLSDFEIKDLSSLNTKVYYDLNDQEEPF